MKTVRKNISSLWKARKERLSGTRQTPQRRKERSWRNSVRARKFLCLKPHKGIKIYAQGGVIPTDSQIYKNLGLIEFKFGDEVHTVEEAKLLFTYEIGLDLRRVYVIALSEYFGAIVFYLPEELADMIYKRAVHLGEEFSNYLGRIIEEQSNLRRAMDKMSSYGIDADAAGEALIQLSKVMSEAAEPEKKQRSNNWLKLHGLPMRRKGKGRKKYE